MRTKAIEEYSGKITVSSAFSEVRAEYKTRKAADKAAKRMYQLSTDELLNTFIRISNVSHYGYELKKGQKIYQVCTHD